MAETATERLLREFPRHPDWTVADWVRRLGVSRVRVHQIKKAHRLKIPRADAVTLAAARRAGAEIQKLGLTKAAAPELFEKMRKRHLRQLRKTDGRRSP